MAHEIRQEKKLIYTLENELFKVEVSTKGAEIQSFVRKSDLSNVVWKGSEDVWKFHAPLLFPFIGRCVNGYFDIEGVRAEYSKNHGFARDVEHSVIESDSTHVKLELRENDELLKVFPYRFSLVTEYILKGNTLEWKTEVRNLDSKTFGFNFGTHTAFACNPYDVTIEFEKKSPLRGIKTTEEGYLAPLVNCQPDSYVYGEKNPGIVTVPSEGFGNGHILFNNASDYVELSEKATGRKVRIGCKGFPYVMLWQNTKGSPQFVCIEPWFGLPDSGETDNCWEHKFGQYYVGKGKSFTSSQNITVIK